MSLILLILLKLSFSSCNLGNNSPIGYRLCLLASILKEIFGSFLKFSTGIDKYVERTFANVCVESSLYSVVNSESNNSFMSYMQNYRLVGIKFTLGVTGLIRIYELLSSLGVAAYVLLVLSSVVAITSLRSSFASDDYSVTDLVEWCLEGRLS